MKFNIGDKVKVRSDIHTSFKKCYAGAVGTVVSKGRNGIGEPSYILKFEADERDSVFWWQDSELENSTAFTKSDLKDGMVVEYRNGDRCVVINGYFMKPTGYGWMPINDYDDELHSKGGLSLDRAYDIVKVYSSKAKNMPDYCDASKLTLIWERKEEPEYTEMTVEEIEEKLGYKVKVIADK